MNSLKIPAYEILGVLQQLKRPKKAARNA